MTAADLARAVRAFHDQHEAWCASTQALSDELRLDPGRFLLEFQAPHVLRIDPIVTGDRSTDHRPRLGDLARALGIPGEVRIRTSPTDWPTAAFDRLESALPRLALRIGVDIASPQQAALLYRTGALAPGELDGLVVTNITITRRDIRPEHDAAAAARLIEQVRAMLDPPPARGLPAIPDALTRYPFDAQAPHTIVIRVRTWIDVAVLQARLGGDEATRYNRPCRRFGPVYVLAYPLAPPLDRWLDRLQLSL